MSSLRTEYAPWFSPQRDCSQRDEPLPDHIMDQDEPPRQSSEDKRGNKRVAVGDEKARFHLKVKLPKFSKKATEDKTQRKWTIEATAKTTLSRGRGARCKAAKSGAGIGTGSVGGDKRNEREKANIAVLRTISKVLEENQLIRERLAALSQAC